MKVSELHAAFLGNLQILLPEWRFVTSQRHFKKSLGNTDWFLHICCINHPTDFDAVGNVAVEFTHQRKRIAIVGASLGNIEGIGQVRHPVASLKDCVQSAKSLEEQFQRVGVPFLLHYSKPQVVIAALRAGGPEARLISPIEASHPEQVETLLRYAGLFENPPQAKSLRGSG